MRRVPSPPAVGKDADSGDTVSYSAAAGENNRVRVWTTTYSGSTKYVIRDNGARSGIADGDGSGGCAVSGRSVTCPSNVRLAIDLKDGKDRAYLRMRSVTAPAASDTVSGGAGIDNLRARYGAALLDGGADRDTIKGGIADYSSRTSPVKLTTAPMSLRPRVSRASSAPRSKSSRCTRTATQPPVIGGKNATSRAPASGAPSSASSSSTATRTARRSAKASACASSRSLSSATSSATVAAPVSTSSSAAPTRSRSQAK